MKQAKVQEITKVNEWKGPNGTIFYINMKLDNGETISLGKKSKDAFKVGDQVNYEVVEEGKKWKEVKENPFKPRVVDSTATNRSATIGMALKIAFEVLYDKKEQNFNECIALAHRIYEEAMAMYNGTKEEKAESKDDEYSDLPF